MIGDTDADVPPEKRPAPDGLVRHPSAHKRGGATPDATAADLAGAVISSSAAEQ